MDEFSDLNELIRFVTSRHAKTIGIDGVDGAGKSSLAKVLSETLSIAAINVDDFLEKDKGNYVAYIDRKRLSNEVKHAEDGFVIEGVCLLDVLAEVNITLDLLIYIKRMSEHDQWRDQDECDIEENIDDFVARHVASLKEFCIAEARIEGRRFIEADFCFPPLREEIFRYHHRNNPHKNADVIYARKEC